jgi:hypothetical protein
MFTAGHTLRATGLTYRQLDHIVRNRFLRPSHQAAQGQGTLRQFSTRDLLALRLAKEILAAGLRLRPFMALLHFVQRDPRLPPLDKIRDITLMVSGGRGKVVVLDGKQSHCDAQEHAFSIVLHLGPAAEHVRRGIERLARKIKGRKSNTNSR